MSRRITDADMRRFRITGKLELYDCGRCVEFMLSVDADDEMQARAALQPLLGPWHHVIEDVARDLAREPITMDAGEAYVQGLAHGHRTVVARIVAAAEQQLGAGDRRSVEELLLDTIPELTRRRARELAAEYEAQERQTFEDLNLSFATYGGRR